MKGMSAIEGGVGDKKRSGRVVFFAVFSSIVTLCFPLLSMPPVWDAAAGVFSPAAYIYQGAGGFSHLLTLPGYIDGGPDTHPLSLYTLFVAFSMWLFNGVPGHFLPFLHLLNVIASSLIVVLLYRNLEVSLGRVRAALCAAALLLYPVFLVQVGYIYTEIPGALFSILSLHFWVRRQDRAAVAWALAALGIKGLGLAPVAALAALMVLELAFRAGSWKKAAALLVLIAGSAALTTWRWHFETIPDVSIRYPHYLKSVLSYLLFVPDLLVFSLFVPYSLWLFLLRMPGVPFPGAVSVLLNRDRFLLGVLVFSSAFLGLMMTISLSGKMFFPMPRYYVWALPEIFACAFLALNHLLSPFSKDRARFLFVVLLAGLLLFFGLNRSGRFYPEHNAPITSFSLVERSLEYLDFFRAQKEAAHYVDVHFSQEPVYVTRGEYYFMSSPLLGYVEHSIPERRFVLSVPHPAVWPDHFVIVDSDSNDFHGQAALKSLLQSLYNDPRFRVDVRYVRHFGAHYCRVYQVTRQESPSQ